MGKKLGKVGKVIHKNMKRISQRCLARASGRRRHGVDNSVRRVMWNAELRCSSPRTIGYAFGALRR